MLGWANLARRGCRRKFLNCQKFATAAMAEMTYLLGQSRMGRTQQNVKDHNKTWSMSVAGREARVIPGNS